MEESRDRAPKGGVLVLLVVAVCGGALFALRASPAHEGGASVAMSASAVAEAAHADAATESEGPADEPYVEKPAVPFDPASREIPRPEATPPQCTPPQVAVNEAGFAGRTLSGCVEGEGAARVRVGRWTIVESDGRIAAGYFVNGREEGVWTTWYANGTRTKVQPFEAGVLNGTQVEWLPSGQRFAERTYRHGALDGPATITYPDGTIAREDWRQGIRVSQESGR